MGKAKELFEACRIGNIELIGAILHQNSKRGGPLSSFRRIPSLNCQDINGYTPLHHACLNGHTAIVQLLLENNVNPNLPDKRGSTPLYLASWAGHYKIVKMLLTHPIHCNPNKQTTDSDTPLHCAAQHGHNCTIAILLNYGADSTIRNNQFQTPLDLAAQFGRLQAVQLLLRTNPDLLEQYKLQDNSHSNRSPFLSTRTPTKHFFTYSCLHLASRNGHKKVVETLLEAGMDVNTITVAGTALHEAALYGKISVVTVLLKAGVDLNIKDCQGRTALDLLKEYPPHVTYKIVSIIEDFIQKLSTEKYFKPINPICNSNENPYEVFDFQFSKEKPKKLLNSTNDLTLPNKNGTKNATAEKISEGHQWTCDKPEPKNSNALSSSISSLDESTISSEFYLRMRPIPRKFSDSNILNSRSDSPLKTPILFNKNNSTTNLPFTTTMPTYLHSNSANPIKGNISNSRKASPVHQEYRCVDEYVQMKEPKLNHSSRTVAPLFIPSTLESEKDTLYELKHQLANVTDCHQKQQTPDLPPPSVKEAENTIYEFIQPLTTLSKTSTLNAQCTDEYNEELATFVMENISLEDPPESISSFTSDCIKFVGHEPFAGLFKGSALNLLDDNEINKDYYRNCSPFELSSGLQSPSLVQAISSTKPVPPKKTHLLKSNDNITHSNAWNEIETIFENIGNEVEKANNFSEVTKADDLKIRNPSDLLFGENNNLSLNSTKWRHSSNALIVGNITYNVFYLGSTVIRELQGTISTRKSIQRLKLNEKDIDELQDQHLVKDCSTSTKYLKANNQQERLEVGISMSHLGVKFIDDEKKSTICIHQIENINCVCQDSDDLRYFAYITKEDDIHYCHVFMVDKIDLATEIILTLGQAFEVAYQLAKMKTSKDPILEQNSEARLKNYIDVEEII